MEKRKQSELAPISGDPQETWPLCGGQISGALAKVVTVVPGPECIMTADLLSQLPEFSQWFPDCSEGCYGWKDYKEAFRVGLCQGK